MQLVDRVNFSSWKILSIGTMLVHNLNNEPLRQVGTPCFDLIVFKKREKVVSRFLVLA